MGGVELFEKVRGAGMNLPFVFTSGYLGGGEKETVLPRDRASFLPKPWRRKTLLSCVRGMLDGEGAD
jgi:hypothetical protein